MNKIARYTLVKATEEVVVIRDLGPWDRYPTITNSVEEVVAEVHETCNLDGRRLLYYDSAGNLDEILVKGGKFAGFKAGGPDEET